MAVITSAAGFFAGVRVEKRDDASGSSSIRLPGPTAGATASTPGGAALGPPATDASGVSSGTVVSVRGRYVWVKESSGKKLRVELTSSTSVSQTSKASRSAVRPGDTVVVQGSAASDGTVSAASVSDSESRAGSSSSSASSKAGSAG